MTIPNPDHLLEQTDRLAAAPVVGPPRQADLRRAISTSYYALFHAIATDVADLMIGRRYRATNQYELIYRSLEHTSLRNLCNEVQKQTLPARYAKYEPASGFGDDIKAVAAAVAELQEKRHSADYNPLLKFRTSDAVLAVSTARAAIGRLRSAPSAKKRAFLPLCVVAPRS